jgi:hypothetical protein
MRHRLVAAWIEMTGTTIIAGTVLAIDFMRQRPFAEWTDAILSLSLSATIGACLIVPAGARLRGALASLNDPRSTPPNAWGTAGIIVLALIVLLALAPTLIRL